MAIEVKDLAVSSPGHTRQAPERAGFHVMPFPATGLAPQSRDVPASAVIAESATPREVILGTLPHPRLRLLAPIRLQVQREDGSVTVWAEDLEEVGYGPDLGAAIQDFQQTLIELYTTLDREHDRLGPGMAQLWRRLGQLIESRP